MRSFLLIPDDKPFLLMVGWTLSYEVLFHLTFAVGLLLVAERGPLLAALATLAGGLLFLGLALESSDLVLWVLTSPLLLEFVFGAALACWASQSDRRSTIAGFVLIAGALVIYAAGQIWRPGEGGNLRILTYGLPAALLVTGAVLTRFHFTGRFWQAAILLGSASYSLYLSHWLAMNPIGVLWSKIGLASDILLALIIVTTCIAWAVLTFRFVEQTIITSLLNVFSGRRHPVPAEVALSSGVPTETPPSSQDGI